MTFLFNSIDKTNTVNYNKQTKENNMYTKGKWIVKYKLNVESENGRHIASCGLNTSGDQKKVMEENEANARLIAAAPELLEACKKALKGCSTPITQKDNEEQALIRIEIQQAIEKSEGK